VSDSHWTQRVWVLGFAAKRSAVFDFHMVRSLLPASSLPLPN
jgi:hypothetical protein